MSRIRPRIIYWDNIPAPYAVERFNLLADRGTLDFSAWFSRRTDLDRRWEVDESTWRFKASYVEDPSESLASMHRFIKRCDEIRPDLVVSLYGERPFVAGHLVMKGMGVATAFVVERTFDAWVRRTWWKETAKAFLFRSADAAQVHTAPPYPGGRHDAPSDALLYAARYGFTPDRMCGVGQSIDGERYGGATAAERDLIRAQTGAKGCLFLYVGRYWKGKGLPVLLDAFKEARRADPTISLLTIGNGEDEEALRHAAADIAGLTVWPFVQERELVAAYGAADVFVFPSLGDPFGIVIEEAHAAGLPVITTDAVGDVRQRVVDSVSGFVVPSGNAAALAERMRTLAADCSLRTAMGSRGAARVRAWGHERWVDDFERFVHASLALPRRNTAASRAACAVGGLAVAAADIGARTRTWLKKKAAGGVLPTMQATIVARANRLGMWLVSLPWRVRLPQHTLRRFGTKLGGWRLPVDRLTGAGVCYCAGVGEDTSLEEDLLRTTGCRIWSFDPTPESAAHVAKQSFDPARFRFVPVGIGDRTETARFFAHHDREMVPAYSAVNLWQTTSYFEAPCTTVMALMREFGHDSLALLKLSIEGAEWRVLTHLLDSGMPSINVFCVVFTQPAPFWRAAAAVRDLHRHGFRYLCHDQWKFTFVRPPTS
jgi:FkbM family methyltransferase